MAVGAGHRRLLSGRQFGLAVAYEQEREDQGQQGDNAAEEEGGLHTRLCAEISAGNRAGEHADAVDAAED